MEANDIFLMEGKSIRQLKSAAELESFHCHQPPRDYQLDLGNICNLKCRTCFSQYSSRIAADPVHRRWEGVSFHAKKWAGDDEGTSGHKSSEDADHPVRRRFPSKLPWYENHDLLTGELLASPQHITGLQIIGGEPLVARQIAATFQHIANNGLSGRVSLNLTTNGTIFDQSLFNTLAEFGNVSFSVSIDGIGEHFEYIRYPGKWAEFLGHIDKYAKMKNVKLYVLPTFHIYNALHITDVFRFCNEPKFRLIFNTLWTPHFQAASVPPPKTRRAAMDRFMTYARTTRVNAHRQLAETLARELEEKGGSIDKDLLRQFMLFTNDLDSTRPTRFKVIHGETIALMAEDGIEWTDETPHGEMREGS